MSGSMGRPAYVIRRLLQAVPVVFAILILNFLLLHLAPGDAAQVLAGEAGSATPEYMAQLRQRFGLDRSLAVQLVLYVKRVLTLDWLPTSGMETVGAFYEGWARVLDIGRHLVLPALSLSLFYLALYVRLMRAAVLEQAAMDYVTTARAKGLNEIRITLAHVMRNAVLPVV